MKRLGAIVLLILSGLLLLVVWYLSPAVLDELFNSSARALGRRAAIGESFGAVSALFSALALFGLVFTAFMQRAELASQRRELELQRRELIESRQELHRSAEASLRARSAPVSFGRPGARRRGPWCPGCCRGRSR